LAKRLFTRNESDRPSFDHLLESLREDWQPDGTLEEILLEKIAIGYYKLHVVYGYEAENAQNSVEFFFTIDRTGRYATSINRQLTQDVNQFERLQRQRKGEFVPAPISVDLTVSGFDGEEQGDVPTIRDSSATPVTVLSRPEVPHVSSPDFASDPTPSSGPVPVAELASVETSMAAVQPSGDQVAAEEFASRPVDGLVQHI
jgi:hypothetical protein